MGSCLSIFIYYIFPYRHFLNLKFQLEISLFFACDFLSHLVGANVMLTYGVPFESFYILYLPLSSFFVDLKLLPEIGIDFARDFLSPGRELMEFSPMGSDLSFVIFNIFSYLHFLYLKLYKWNRPFFFTRDFLYIDGWDGTDGRSTFFFLPHTLKTAWHFFHN